MDLPLDVMHLKPNKYLAIAILIGLAYHGTTMFFTLEETYDAMVHVFFAEHYAHNWFESWNYKWYTGFSVMSYTPLVHQSIALLSFIVNLKFGLFVVTMLGVILFISAVYRFSFMLTSNKTIAGYAAIFATVSSSFIETLHFFGQLPSIIGVSFLLLAMPQIYFWLRTGKYRYLFSSLSLIGIVVVSHHVTIIFGTVFFVFPLIGMVVMDISREEVNTFNEIKFTLFLASFLKIFNRILIVCVSIISIVIVAILPYWINSKKNPITQVPIPHGSRDNFFEITSSGLIFFLIPWGILLCILPYLFFRYFSKRYLFFGISLSMLLILGTGSTTPIPKLILGENAFDILTLDRFTFWACIMALPMFGEFMYRLTEKDLKSYIEEQFGFVLYRLSLAIISVLTVFMIVFTTSLRYFRPTQPQKIEIQPIVNFLNQDEHNRWRYLTLGFGDQMAWLGAKTNALSIDGNYHSARRIPELTTRAIERLENSKYKGVEGIGSLQQFLTIPEKYNLKYIFSNDRFYDPILYFCGWQRLMRLNNGIMVWEKLNIKPLSFNLPREEVPLWQKTMWGIAPLGLLLLAFIINVQRDWIRKLKKGYTPTKDYFNEKISFLKFPAKIFKICFVWCLVLFIWISFGLYQFHIKNDAHHSPKNVILAYFDALDFSKFEKAYTLINPTSGLSLEQYMLEISSTNGLLTSYSKLDNLESTIIFKNDHLAHVSVITTYITPLEKIEKKSNKTLVKFKGKWYINPEKLDLDTPPDQLYSANSTKYYNHGRKRITTEKLYHEDLLKQPALEILSAKLVQYGNQYALVGEIQNIDNMPADIAVKGTLYNDESEEIAVFNAKYDIKHKLMPKEITSFKINFEGIAWSNVEDFIPTSFNPNEFTQLQFKVKPTKFNVQAAAMNSGSDLFKDLAISHLSIHGNNLSGTLFNSGLHEVTIPQILVSYYTENKTLIWVDHLFLNSGIKQQRKLTFQHTLMTMPAINVISDDMSNCFVNGIPNEKNAHSIVPNRIKHHSTSELQSTDSDTYPFIKIELNSYIGKPN